MTKLMGLFALALALPATLSAQFEYRGITSAAQVGGRVLIGLPPRGSLADLAVRGLVDVERVSVQSFPLPRELFGLRVSVGGSYAPLLRILRDPRDPLTFFVRLQVPHEMQIGEGGLVPIIAEYGGMSVTAQVPMLATYGDFLRLPGYGFSRDGPDGVFQHAADYSLVTPENPARPGEELIGYATGLVGSLPRVPTGEAAPFSPLAIVLEQMTAPGFNEDYYRLRLTDNPNRPTQTLEIRPAFLGMAPGLAGVYQVNFRVPESWPGGSTWVRLYRHYCRPTLSGLCRPSDAGGTTSNLQMTSIASPQ